jgi:hypothetical protein
VPLAGASGSLKQIEEKEGRCGAALLGSPLIPGKQPPSWSDLISGVEHSRWRCFSCSPPGSLILAVDFDQKSFERIPDGTMERRLGNFEAGCASREPEPPPAVRSSPIAAVLSDQPQSPGPLAAAYCLLSSPHCSASARVEHGR